MAGRVAHAPAARVGTVREAERDARFRAFVVAYRERAWRLAWRLVGGDAAAAEDVAQEAFVKAYRALDRFREEASLATWFYRILVRQAQSYWRWQAVRAAWRRQDQQPAAPQGPGDPLLRRRIATALGRLSPSQRTAFVLVHLEGFSVREAAQVMAKPEGTVKSHLHRALRLLRQELADLADDTGGQAP
ncbi:MAG: RNA polymerase sigma factor [Candidatus Tectimicrobiota bacterium]|nr:MAG: RNA polymerase sigma factor [Candidatus Tectomicrobia bacterium]